MAHIVRMPKLGMTMQDGTIYRWVKREGENVTVSEILVEVENDKAIVEVPAEHGGVLRKILAPPGAIVPVSGPMAILGTADEPIDHLLGPIELTAGRCSETVDQKETSTSPEQGAQTHRLNASPAAKALAVELGVDLASVKGTGPSGRITKDDVLRASAPFPSGPRILETIPLSGMRKLIAQVVSTSKREIPHFYVTADMDLTTVVERREALGRENRRVPSITVIIAYAACQALREFPVLNSSFEGDSIRVYETINLGVTVAFEGGLAIANLPEAGSKTLDELDEQLTQIAERFRSRKFTPEEGKGSTFTISNLGQFGVREFAAIIPPPQTAILALGQCEERVIVRHGETRTRWMMSATLSCDHRVIDGATAAEFLRILCKKLDSLF